MISSAISRVSASLATLRNENALQLASLNFDFTLVKLEAPKEFSGVGALISPARKQNAESGTIHRTARKLGALFKGVPPITPNLFEAYGKCVSEICEIEEINPRGTKQHGLFSKHIGADAASIWAAVTSGEEAIAIYLLACMIARMFTGPEATSLWMELISQRKTDIEIDISKASFPSELDSAAFAVQQEISRDEIANWDNSA